MTVSAAQSPLIEFPDDLPHGLVCRHEFLTVAEEVALLDLFSTLPFREARFKEYYAKRRVVLFDSAGTAGRYDDSDEIGPAHPLPPLLVELREKVATFVDGVLKAEKRFTADDFVHVLVSEYQPGTPIGWHRDREQYGIVAGVSLASRARMRFRPLPAPGAWDRVDPKTLIVLDLEPRSIYLMRDEIRWQWHHSLLPTKALRYSVTMRTLEPSATSVGSRDGQ